MAAPPQGPFATPAFLPWINRWVGFAMFYAFVAVFRLSDVVYLANMRSIVGQTQLLAEDVQMMFYASFIGMTIIFPLLFRLKFRFTTKGILTGVTLSLCVLNVLFMKLLEWQPWGLQVPLLVLLAFVSGALRIWGMFECMSSIMTGITRQRDFAVFFPVIYFTVVGFIQVTGFVATHISYHYSWQWMNYLDIALLLIVCFLVQVLMRHVRLGPPMLLLGIDWLGGVLWAIVLGALTFLATYGDYLEWSGPYMATASSVAFLAAGINLGRMKHIRHPFLCYQLFRYPNVSSMLLLFFLLCLLLSAQTSLQNVLTGQVLRFDALSVVSLNIPQFLGIATGAVFSRYALTHLGWTYKQLTFAGFLFVVYYLAAMYFLVDPAVNIEKFYLPVFFLGAGNVVVYVSVTVYAQKIIPFQHFFQGLCLLGFVRTGIANPISGAIYTRLFKVKYLQHAELLGSDVNPHLSTDAVAAAIHQQATLATLKELYGLAVVAGVVTLLIIIGSRFKPQINYLVPTDWIAYKRLLKWNTKLQKKHPRATT